jgi:hypothetical protein
MANIPRIDAEQAKVSDDQWISPVEIFHPQLPVRLSL